MALSHSTAACLWEIEPVAPGVRIDVTLPRSRRAGEVEVDFAIHRNRLGASDVGVRFGMPVTSPARTLLDLAGVVSPEVLGRSADDLLRRRQVTPAALDAAVRGFSGRGLRHIAVLRSIVEARSAGVGDSPAVDRLARWLVAAGLPEPVPEHRVVVAGRQRIIDLAYPVWRVAVEFHGWAHHQMRSRADADHARTTELELQGWLVIVVTAGHGREETVDRVRRALLLREGT